MTAAESSFICAGLPVLIAAELSMCRSASPDKCCTFIHVCRSAMLLLLRCPYVCAGLPVVTAEREEALLRADRAEFEMRQLADQRNVLLQQLESAQSNPRPSPGLAPAGTAPARDNSSAGFGPAPESISGDSADLTAQVAELTQQLEDMNVRYLALEAELVSEQGKLTERESSAAQVGAN